jgi:hypothetical protein
MDESLKSFARAYVLRSRPDVDHRSVDDYVASLEFGLLVGKFESALLAVLDKFLERVALTAEAGRSRSDETRAAALQPASQPARAPVAPRKMSFAELSNAAAAGISSPAEATAQAPVLPDMPVSAAPTPFDAPAEPDAKPAAPAAPAAQTAPVAPVPVEGLATPPGTAAPAAPAAPSAPLPGTTPVRPAVQEALTPPDLPDIGFRLPNARAGSEYVQSLEAVDSSEAVVLDDVLVPEGLSMKADLQTGTVAGTPLVAGEYTISVTYHFARQSPSRRRRAQVPVTVAPDPRTMWKNLASERSDPYWKEDEQHSSVRGPELSIVAASKRGRSHAHVGGFRDDDYRIEHLADSSWYVAVLADGAGSARYSRRGAAIICEHARNHIRSSLTDNTAAQIDASARAYAEAQTAGLPPEQAEALRQELHTMLSRIVGNAAYWAVKAIHDEIQARQDLGGIFKDYSSTALIAACKRYPFGTLCAAYWIGDGAIGIYSKRDGITLLGDVDSGEFSGQTRFLDNTAVDHEVLRKRTRFAIVPDMTALVLMTDGVSDAKFETEARLARAADWHQFWGELDQAVGFAGQAPEQDSRLLDWLDFWSQGNHDDRTIAIIY